MTEPANDPPNPPRGEPPLPRSANGHIGQAAIDAIISRKLVEVECCKDGAHIFVWSANAAEEIGDAIATALWLQKKGWSES